jgi:hypothetical protein
MSKKRIIKKVIKKLTKEVTKPKKPKPTPKPKLKPKTAKHTRKMYEIRGAGDKREKELLAEGGRPSREKIAELRKIAFPHLYE